MTNQRRAPEALRLRHYVERRKRATQLDVNKVHAFDAGCGSEAELLLSDIETLLSLVEAQRPAPTPQADSQPAHQWGTGYPPLPAAYYLAGGVVRTWDEGQMRAYVDADRTARAPADSVTAPAATVIKKGADRQWMSERLGHLPDGIYSLYLAPPAQAAARKQGGRDAG